MKKVVFILPCAGEGKRLGYQGHKELFPILPNQSLINFSLAHIRAASRWLKRAHSNLLELSVVVVIRPWKMDVLHYVQEQLPDIQVTDALFDPALFEWPGSVHSAQHLYGDLNIVLLPDSRMMLSRDDMVQDTEKRCHLERMRLCLSDFAVGFGFLQCSEPERLRQLGALGVRPVNPARNDLFKVETFQDKPNHNLHRFNGFWCCYGFRKDAGTILYEYLKTSVQKTAGDIRNAPFYPAGAFPVHDYVDLGTPASVELFRLREDADGFC